MHKCLGQSALFAKVTRVLRAAKAAGVKVRITVKQDGVQIDDRPANASDVEQVSVNPWDELLTNAEDKERAS